MLFVTYLIIQIFVVTSFKISSDSVDPFLVSGDYVLVDKCTSGARIFDVQAAVCNKEVSVFGCLLGGIFSAMMYLSLISLILDVGIVSFLM